MMLARERLMLQFEALGDNCEFGLVQRRGGAEPLGLLRFAGLYIPIEIRLVRTIEALERRFEGLGALDTMRVELAGVPGNREYIISETAYELRYHSFKAEGEADPKTLRAQEAKKLQFLRRKLLADLQEGAKILVWKSNVPQAEADITRLAATLGAFGPGILLWAETAGPGHPPGSVDWLGPGVLKGYVERFAPYDDATDISYESWFVLCEAAYRLARAADR